MKKHQDNVLVIEDDMWLGEQFERTLTHAGFAVRRTTNGHAAMELIDEHAPDAIVLDLLIIGGTGLTLLHELQSYQDTGDIPVVLCTNLAAQINLDDLAPYGVRRIIDKTTMHPDDIVTALRSVLP
jgi:CheY-like chemotaxis protein